MWVERIEVFRRETLTNRKPGVGLSSNPNSERQSVHLKFEGYADPERYPFKRQKTFPAEGSKTTRK